MSEIEVTLLGIDEAGRGPVIGPMVMCGLLVRKGNLEALEKLNIKDSKALTPARRESLVDPIRAVAEDAIIRVISPGEIDRNNINFLDIRNTVEIIRETRPTTLFLDVPTHPSGIGNYVKSIHVLLKKANLSVDRIHAENKADEKYVVVAAASILAKVERDSIIDSLKERYGDFGSGYPGDPKTVEFLRKLKGRRRILPIVRKKWNIRALEAEKQETMPINTAGKPSSE